MKDLLDATSDVVVLLADHVGVEDTRSGVERIDGRVDAELGNTARQHGLRVQVSECGGRGGIGQIVGGHVDGLHGGDGALGGGGDTLLHSTHVSGECWLVADGGRDAAEQGGHLGAGLGESENVVDEEQHVLALDVTEVLGNGETGESDTSARSRWLVHLTVDKRHLRAVALQVNDLGGDHLVVEIVALARTLAHACEHRVATVRLGHVVDELHDKHSLADAGAAEQADLATLGVGREQVDDLDARLENLLLDAHRGELGRLGVNGRIGVAHNRTALVNRIADDVHDAAESGRTDRNADRRADVVAALAANKTLRTVHGNCAHRVATCCNFKQQNTLQDKNK